MTTINLDRDRLAAVALFAGRLDVRYYLNAVCVEWLPDGRPLLVATNGHCLGAIPGVEKRVDDPPAFVKQVLIDVAQIDAFLRVAVKGAPVSVTFNDVHATASDAADVTLGAANGARFTRAGVDGKFPEWRRIVKTDGPAADKDRGTLPISCDPAYIAMYDKASKILVTGRGKQSIVTLTHWAPDMQIRVTLPRCPDFFGIVMPCRADDTSGSLPAWFTARQS